MGVKLIWTTPDSESTYDYVYIYRATSETGTYTNIANQAISDDTYFDMNGTSSSWYKIRFYDSSNVIWSDYSDAMQGGYFGSYCTVQDVKDVMDVPSSVTDEQIFRLSRIASTQVNSDILTHVYKERVQWVDQVKTNDIDGSNTDFYTKNFPLGDLDSDYKVDENDVHVFKVREVSSVLTETEVTVSSVDIDDGKITLSSAPESDSELYITYCYTPRHYPVDPVHDLIRRATAYLTAFMLKNKIQDESIVSRYTLDRLTVVKMADTARHDYNKYRELIDTINNTMEVGERESRVDNW